MSGHVIGVGRARELLLTGEPISGETAFAWGLVNRLSSLDELINTTADLLRLATRHLPDVIAAQKRLHQQWLDLPYTAAVERSVEAFGDGVRNGQPQEPARTPLDSRRAPIPPPAPAQLRCTGSGHHGHRILDSH